MARKEPKAGQRFFCEQPGCTKNYSRLDHLMRHKLNHDTRKEDLLRCEQCGKTFVRQDLLTRHLERHEARGQALGRWVEPSTGGGGGPSKKKKGARGAESEEEESDAQHSEEGDASPTMARAAVAPVPAAAVPASRAPMPPVKRARVAGPSTLPPTGTGTGPPHEWDPAQRYAQPAPPPPAHQPSLYLSVGNASDAEAAARAAGQWAGYWPASLLPSGTPSAAPLPHAHGEQMAGNWRNAALVPPQNPQSNAAWLPQHFAHPAPSMYAPPAGSPNPQGVVPYWAGHDAHSNAAGSSRMAQMGHAAMPSGTVRAPMHQHAAYSGDAEAMSTPGSSNSMPRAHSSAGGSAGAPVLNGRGMYTNAASVSSSAASRPTAIPPHVSPGATFSGPTGPDAYPFAAPPQDHSAEYGWLLDGADPFSELESSDAESRRQSAATPAGAGAGGGFADPSPAMLVETAARKAEEKRYEEAQARGEKEHAGGGAMSPTGLLVEAATRMMHGGDGGSEERSPLEMVEQHTTPQAQDGGAQGPSLASERDGMQCDGIDNKIQPAAAGRGQEEQTALEGSGLSALEALLQFGTSDNRHDQGEEGEEDAEEHKNWFRELEATLPHEESTYVTEATRQRLLRFLATIPELPQAPLFTPRAISCYLFLFFSKYSYIYPLIHRPSFVAQHADAMLLSAMIVIGAHFADLPNHVLGVRIGSKLWGAYFSLDDFLPARATLPMLQAMLLTEAFGKLMATRPQHETCHLMHGAVVTLARRNACFHAASSAAQLPGEPGSEEQWLAWVREEEKKRIALFCFVLDAQHATLFRHTPALSAFQIQLQLPCDEEEWQAPNASDWFAVRSVAKREPPFFIAALKACMTAGGKSPPVGDTFSRFILFHGLLSVAYDLQWKRHTLIDPLRASDWREKLSASFASWKTRLDAACAHPTASLTAQAIFKASSSLVVWSQIVLVADTVDIQIYAGLPSVLGRFIDRSTFMTARKNVKEWAGRADGRIAVWYAAHFLRATLLGNGSVAFVTKTAASNPALEHLERAVGPRRPSDVALYELVHHQWIMYLCALVVWAYGQALEPVRSTDSGSGGAKPRADADASYASLASRDPRSSATEYLDAMATPVPEDIADVAHAQCHTAGVLALVEHSLRASSARWELLDEGADVLRKLISASEALGAGEGKGTQDS